MIGCSSISVEKVQLWVFDRNALLKAVQPLKVLFLSVATRCRLVNAWLKQQAGILLSNRHHSEDLQIMVSDVLLGMWVQSPRLVVYHSDYDG